MIGYSIAPEARHDLLDIWDYIAQFNLDAADRVRDELFEAFERLADWPNLGRTYEGPASATLRTWRVRNFVVFYRAEMHPIEIVRVFSSYRDISSVIDPNS